MATFVPLISSNVAGPLGVVHLPRLWSKVLLSAKGLLPEGYDECGKGFDQMLLDGLQLNREATLNYVKQNLPTYPDFEKWVLEQRGGMTRSPSYGSGTPKRARWDVSHTMPPASPTKYSC